MAPIATHKIPKAVEKQFSEISKLIEHFCKDNLDAEYEEVCIKLLSKLARKRPSPLLSGRKGTWAAGIVHAIGLVNFVFDKSQSPHISSKQMCEWFNLGASTVSGKSKAIRDLFKISQLDFKWCLPSRLKDHPMAWMVMLDGYIIDARTLSYDMQVEAYEAGAIPGIPDNLLK